MKKIYNLLFVFAMVFTFTQTKAQTAFIFGLGTSESFNDSLKLFDNAVPATFGSRLHYNIDSVLIGQVVIVKDKLGMTTTCDSILEDLSGKIALIDRGSCTFDLKCYNAWKKGAKAIIIVNSDNLPAFIMSPSTANAAKAALINVPCIMITKAQGNEIKGKIASDPFGYSAFIYQPNFYPNNAYAIAPKEWISPKVIFSGGTVGDTTIAKNAAWFKYTPTKTGKSSISSCGKGANTSLYLYELVGNGLNALGSSLNACPKNFADTQNEAAALNNISVKAGTTYYMEWNDFASPDSFNFVLSFVKADSADVTFRVDMKNEKVDAKGVHLAGFFQGWDPAKTLCDNVAGSSIWSKKIRVASDATYEYKFVNGDAWGKDESVSGVCAAGANGNRKIDVKTEPIDLAAVCFKSCEACVNLPLVCDADAIICDDFDKYTVGGLNAQSTNWDVWDGDALNSGDGIVTTENSASGKNSLKIDGVSVPPQDVIFDAGAKTKGSYILKHKMFVPKGKRAYYSIQHDITKAKHVWANDVYLDTKGNGRVEAGGKIIGTLTYKHDTWFEVVQTINIAKDTTTITINGKTLGWKWSAGTNGTAVVSNSQLGGFDFYADSTNTKYYVDDVQLIQPRQNVTFSVDMGALKVDSAGVHIAGDFQALAGFPAIWQPNTTKLTKGAGTIYSTTVKIPDGDYQFKYINGNTWGKDESVGGTSCDAGGGNRGASISGNTILNTVCFAKCFACDRAAVTFAIDLTNEKAVSPDGVSIAGNFQGAAGGTDWSPGVLFLNTKGKKIYTVTVGIPVGKYEYKFINGKAWGTDESVTGSCAASNGNRTLEVKALTDLRLDTVCFKKCYSCDKREVTFSVDMSLEKAVSTDGVSIAGNFQTAAGGAANWSPGIIFLKDNGKKVYSTTIPIRIGSYEYKFINGNSWGKDETATGTCAVSGGGNRKITVGTVDTKLDTVCYNYCVSCKKVLYTNDANFDAAMNVYPNPAQTEVNLQYNFTEATNLEVRILNTLGQVLYNAKMPNVESGTAILELNNLSNGAYMIQVTDEKQRQSVKRLMIQK